MRARQNDWTVWEERCRSGGVESAVGWETVRGELFEGESK